MLSLSLSLSVSVSVSVSVSLAYLSLPLSVRAFLTLRRTTLHSCTHLSQLLNAPWSDDSLQVLKRRFSVISLPPPKPSLKLMAACLQGSVRKAYI